MNRRLETKMHTVHSCISFIISDLKLTFDFSGKVTCKLQHFTLISILKRQ